MVKVNCNAFSPTPPFPWHAKFDSHEFINIKMNHSNLESEISDVDLELHANSSCDITTKIHVCKKFCKGPSRLTFIKILGLNITLTEKLPKRQKVIRTIMYDGKLNQNYI